ncbi:hypothetical protein DFR42_10577 [Undibacterium pigrum]|uniref:Uncharacterized protein n=1 Tax=Undibacterium pigrum TaxID=401470 RepID=A0A318J708_9BURK|nr:hypothetical protein DFR42_10577 [Undibacterium pigrum]
MSPVWTPIALALKIVSRFLEKPPGNISWHQQQGARKQRTPGKAGHPGDQYTQARLFWVVGDGNSTALRIFGDNIPGNPLARPATEKWPVSLISLAVDAVVIQHLETPCLPYIIFVTRHGMEISLYFAHPDFRLHSGPVHALTGPEKFHYRPERPGYGNEEEKNSEVDSHDCKNPEVKKSPADHF